MAPPDLTKAATVDKEHGRLETRTIAASAEVVPHLQWPGAAQVARIERTREIGDKRSVEVAYIVTSLPATQAGPDRLFAAVARPLGHREQAALGSGRVDERGPLPRPRRSPLAALRNLVLWLIRSRGLSVPEARENFREDRAHAVAIVTGLNL